VQERFAKDNYLSPQFFFFFFDSRIEFKRSQNLEEFAKLEVELQLMGSCNCQFTAPGLGTTLGGAGEKESPGNKAHSNNSIPGHLEDCNSCTLCRQLFRLFTHAKRFLIYGLQWQLVSLPGDDENSVTEA